MIVRLACMLLLTGAVCTPASAQNGQVAGNLVDALAGVDRDAAYREGQQQRADLELARANAELARATAELARTEEENRRTDERFRTALARRVGTRGPVSRRSTFRRRRVAVDRARGRRLWTASVATGLKPQFATLARLTEPTTTCSPISSCSHISSFVVVKSALRKRRSRHRPISREDASWCVTRVARPYTRNPWVAGARYPELYTMRQLLTEDHPLLLAA